MIYRATNLLRKTGYILILAAAVVSCECSGGRNQTAPQSTEESADDRIEASRDFLKKERESIEAYIKDRELEVERTGTGLYYRVLSDSAIDLQVETEDLVEYEYDISLMNGAKLYSSATDGRAELKIDKQDAVIGLHESLKKLGLGDKGLFILPSHLAYGVAGDQDRVPPLTPLVYELKVVNIKKSKSE